MGRCIDYSVRKYITGENPVWKRHASLKINKHSLNKNNLGE
jgi:hypothetical protein